MATAARRGKPRIKPPRKHVAEPSVDDIWQQLSHNIREIHAHNAFLLSFEENHRFAYNIVLHKRGALLYDGVRALVRENLDRLAAEEITPAFPTGAAADAAEQSDERTLLLKALKRVWDDHRENMAKLRDILKYMDRVYTKQAGVPEIWDAGMQLFLERILRAPIDTHLVAAVLAEVRVERDGFVIHRSDVKGCVDVLLSLSDAGAPDAPSVYRSALEPALLAESTAFYRAEGARLLASCSAPEYLARAEARLAAEADRAMHYLSSQTGPALRQILHDELLTPHLRTVLGMRDSGLDTMVDLERVDDLARLYRLFALVPEGPPTLRKAVKDSISSRGKAINDAGLGAGTADADGEGEPQEEDADATAKSKPRAKGKPPAESAASQTLKVALKWVEDVLELKDKFDGVLRGSFQNDRDLESGINEAFESFVNANEKAPEFISLFIDDHLKKGLKGKTDAEVETILDKTITVFRFLTDKDVFERYYKGHLAKRLLLGRSVSDDAERGMLAKFKVECGVAFTQKLEGMFHDMKISADTMRAFREHAARGAAPEVEISVTVMTSTFWPMAHTAAPYALPAALTRAASAFESFYLARHTGRRLTWQPALGHADVRVQFRARAHDLNVATYALVVLLLFQDLADDEFLTYEEILAATTIPEVELQRHLQSLACAKYKVLRKHPPGREVRAGDSFSFNADFSAPLQRIKIATVAARVETAAEARETRERVDEERRHQIDAAVVRVMKDRKHLGHAALVNEVVRQLGARFEPQPAQIKKRIENLIDREYLERCEDRKSYNYLA